MKIQTNLRAGMTFTECDAQRNYMKSRRKPVTARRSTATPRSSPIPPSCPATQRSPHIPANCPATHPASLFRAVDTMAVCTTPIAAVHAAKFLAITP